MRATQTQRTKRRPHPFLLLLPPLPLPSSLPQGHPKYISIVTYLLITGQLDFIFANLAVY